MDQEQELSEKLLARNCLSWESCLSLSLFSPARRCDRARIFERTDNPNGPWHDKASQAQVCFLYFIQQRLLTEQKRLNNQPWLRGLRFVTPLRFAHVVPLFFISVFVFLMSLVALWQQQRHCWQLVAIASCFSLLHIIHHIASNNAATRGKHHQARGQGDMKMADCFIAMFLWRGMNGFCRMIVQAFCRLEQCNLGEERRRISRYRIVTDKRKCSITHVSSTGKWKLQLFFLHFYYIPLLTRFGCT